MTIDYSIPGREHRFFFYETGPGGNSTVNVFLDPSCVFELNEVRFLLSTSHASAVAAICKLSCTQGSAYNATFFSQAMVGLSNYFWQPSQTLRLQEGDQVVFEMIVSATNVWGVYASGWAVKEA